jgi:hypothetical protein
MIDFGALLYDPIYAVLGVPALLTPATDASEIPLTVIDKTEGVVIDEGNSISISTIKPAAVVRMSEISAKGMVRADLKQGIIRFNSGNWTIVAIQPKPSPSGPGELYLILEAVDSV